MTHLLMVVPQMSAENTSRAPPQDNDLDGGPPGKGSSGYVAKPALGKPRYREL